MGSHTLIHWADSTVNPTTGCDGCELFDGPAKGPCYAGALHEGRLAKTLPALYDPSFLNVRLAPGRAAQAAGWPDLTGKPRPDKPWLGAPPRLIFVGDMGDFHSRAVPFEYLADELVAAATSPKGRRHVYLCLTKRPRRQAAFAAWLLAERGVAWPPNLWTGTSVTTRKTAAVRIPELLKVPGKRFLSLEPLWEPVDLTPHLYRRCECGQFAVTGNTSPCPWCGRNARTGPVDWVITGGQSRQGGHAARPFDVDWARGLVGQCRAAGVPVFVKQFGSNPVEGGRPVTPALKDSHGGDWSEWPADLRVREVPDFAAA